MFNHYDLAKQTIFLTGGNGQIGRGLTIALLASGAFVYVADLHDEINPELKKAIQKHKYKRYKYVKIDITKESSIRRAKASLKRAVTVLINNAGIGVYTAFEKRTAEELKSVMDVNLFGTIMCSKIFAKDMIKRKRGKIINTGSVYGMVSPDKRIYGDSGRNSAEIYGVTKAGVIQLSRYLAAYLADRNILVNSISPGGVFNNQKEFFVKNYTNKTPLGRMARVDDLVGLVCFLASEDANYITGQNIAVDGGFTAW